MLMAVDVIAVKMDFGTSKLIIQMGVNVSLLDNFTSLNVNTVNYEFLYIDLFKLTSMIHRFF